MEGDANGRQPALETAPAGIYLGDWGPDEQLGRLNLLTRRRC